MRLRVILCKKKRLHKALATKECDALRDLVPFSQFKKREKHPWRIITLSKVAGFRLQLCEKKHSSMDVFHVSLNYTNGTKSCKASQTEIKYDKTMKKETVILIIINILIYLIICKIRYFC